MNQTPKFDLAIIGLGYVGLPLGLQFTKSGVRFFEDHAVAEQKVATAKSGLPNETPITNRKGGKRLVLEPLRRTQSTKGGNSNSFISMEV
jgi:UDP-N-acetyl-D-mannosaminuronate dehydrogenase